MGLINSHWKIIISVTMLNLLGELGFRSFGAVSNNPIFVAYLAITYLTFAIACEYQITQKKLNGTGLFIFSFILLIVWQMMFPVVIFSPPRILGINWLVFLFVDILMWPTVQTVLFFYLSARIFPRRMEDSVISRKTYLTALIVFCAVTLIPHALFRFAGLANIAGYFILFLTLAIFLHLYKKFLASYPGQSTTPNNSFLLDALGIGIVIVMIICAFFIPHSQTTYNTAHVFNKYAYAPMLITTSVSSLLLYAYRLIFKKQIPV